MLTVCPIDQARDPMPEEWKKAGGWRIHRHAVRNDVLELLPSALQLYLSPNQQNGKSIDGEALEVELAVDKIPVLNACDLDDLLLQPLLIPEAWKTAGVIFFWGTTYIGPNGRKYVRCLCWSGSVWVWSCDWVGHDWNARSPAASLAS